MFVVKPVNTHTRLRRGWAENRNPNANRYGQS